MGPKQSLVLEVGDVGRVAAAPSARPVPVAKLQRDLSRYRYLLAATMDPAAIEALKSLIAEIEGQLRSVRP